MNYALGSEIALFVSIVGSDTQIADAAGQNPMIMQASALLDAAVGGSLEVVPYFDEETRLDQTLSGYLMRRPFRGWFEASGSLFYFGDTGGSSPVTLADFSVDVRSGVLSNLSGGVGSPISSEANGFVSMGQAYSSPYLSNLQQYHRANPNIYNDNSKPYVLRASYYAGWFTEQTVAEDADDGDNEVVLEDVTFLQRGREFYFSSDVPTNAPMVDRRITAIDVDTKTVTFTPALKYDLSATDNNLRMIDKAVRSACCDIIADLLVYPSNTKDFSESLGKGDLSDRWIRMNGDVFLPASAAAKLAPYLRR